MRSFTLLIKKFMKETTFLQKVLFFSILPMSYYYDVALGVVELSDILMIVTFIIFLVIKKNKNNHFYFILKPVITAYFLFNVWCFFTIAISNLTIENPIGTLLMISKQIKHIGYFFIVILFLIKSNSIVFRNVIFFAIAIGLASHFVIQYNQSQKMDIKELELQQSKGFVLSSEKYGAKNGNANLASCYILFLMIYLFRSKMKIPILFLTVNLLLTVIFSVSRGSWIVFFLGLILIWLSLFKSGSIKNKISKLFSRLRVVFAVILFTVVILAINSQFVDDNLFHPKKEYNEKTQEYNRTGSRALLLRKSLRLIEPLDYVVGKGYYSRFYRNDLWSYGAHNQIVQYVWEIGIIGLLLFLNIYFQLYKKVILIKNKKSRYIMYSLLFSSLFTGSTEIFFYAPKFFAPMFVLLMFAYMFFYEEDSLNQIK